MSELQQYYDDFCSGYWADEDPNRCRCGGGGWALSEVDTWHECPIHYKGQIHPEVYCGTSDADKQYEQECDDRRFAVLMEAGVVREDGSGACGYCGDFHDADVPCPGLTCSECGNGFYMPYSECKTCNASVQMEDDENHLPHSEADTYRYEEGDLPF